MRIRKHVLGSLRQLAIGAFDLLLPAVCPACEQRDTDTQGLCADCELALLKLVAAPYCPRCGSGLGPNVPAADDGCRFCPHPLPRFSAVVRLGSYADPLRPLVRRLKYRRQDAHVRRLGAMLATAVAAQTADRAMDVVIPIPMHWRRRLSRGYDHAAMLARAIARPLELPVGNELVRTRPTPPQVHLPRSRRIQNVRGAFAVHDARGVAGARIVLVDDVTTTGATAGEAARTLLSAGASEVLLAVVAKSEAPAAYSQAQA